MLSKILFLLKRDDKSYVTIFWQQVSTLSFPPVLGTHSYLNLHLDFASVRREKSKFMNKAHAEPRTYLKTSESDKI